MFYVMEQAFNSVLTFLIGIIIVRYLGVEVYGQYAIYILSSLFVLNLFYNLVTAPCLMENNDQKEKCHVSTSMMIFFLLFCALNLCLIIVSKYVVIYEYLLIPLYCYFFCVDDCIRKLLIKKERFKLLFIRAILITASFLSLIVNIKSSNSIYSFLFPYMMVLAVIQVIYYFKELNKFQVNISSTLNVYGENIGFYGTAKIQWLSTNLVNLYAYSILPVVSIGAIKSAQNIASIFNFIIISLESYLITEHSKTVNTKRNLGLIKFSVIGSIVISVISTFIVLFNEVVVDIIYPGNNSEIKKVLIILAWLPLGSFLNSMVKVASRLKKEAREILISSLIATILSLLFFSLSHQQYALNSLPISMLIASFGTVLIWVLFIKLFKRH